MVSKMVPRQACNAREIGYIEGSEGKFHFPGSIMRLWGSRYKYVTTLQSNM